MLVYFFVITNMFVFLFPRVLCLNFFHILNLTLAFLLLFW